MVKETIDFKIDALKTVANPDQFTDALVARLPDTVNKINLSRRNMLIMADELVQAVIYGFTVTQWDPEYVDDPKDMRGNEFELDILVSSGFLERQEEPIFQSLMQWRTQCKYNPNTKAREFYEAHAYGVQLKLPQ